MAIETINPTTGERIQVYQEMSSDQVKTIIDQAHAAFSSWRKTTFSERARCLHNAAKLLRKNAKDYALLMAQEMGKPLKGGLGEVEKCAWSCDFYADNAEVFLQPEIVKTELRKSYVTFQPLGVVLAIMPWNFPFWQVIRFAAPALMAGNAGLLKHAPNSTGCAIALENIFSEAGFPSSLFRTLIIDVPEVEKILANKKIAAVTLTGSTRAGKSVSTQASSHVKKSVLELGGSDPYLILEDADLDEAVTICVSSRLTNSGQSCIAAKRFIVVDAVKKQFEELFVKKMKAAKMGNPLDETTEVGPQARFDLRDNLNRQVQESITKGAKCLLGGEIPAGKGAFYPPTVLTDVKEGMPAFDEELFGPVAAIISAKNEAEAIKLANRSDYGLGAAVFTRDIKRGERIAANELEAGCCCVNSSVHSDPRLPFGGVKESGFGRELSHYGIKEFVNIKSVFIG